MPRGLAGQEHPHPSPQAILAREGKPHNWRRSPTARQLSGHPCSTASTDAPKATPGTPGYTVVPAPSQHCSISRQINDFINRCPQCCRDAPPRREPLITTHLPDFPWQKAATDLFEMGGNTYLVVVDYFSRFPEVQQLRSATSRSVISALKGIFGRHGVPETLMSDNGPQYVSAEFTEFARAYGFCHTTSSPHYPQANGLAERTVKTFKRLFKESSDQPLALLSYRTTPLPWCAAELCFGRPLRTDIPRTKDSLTPR